MAENMAFPCSFRADIACASIWLKLVVTCAGDMSPEPPDAGGAAGVVGGSLVLVLAPDMLVLLGCSRDGSGTELVVVFVPDRKSTIAL